jgi:cytidylate kinase
MYRAIGLYMVNNNIELEDEKKVVKELPNISVNLKYEKGEQLIYLNRENVTDKIRTNEISKAASIVSAYKEVRAKLLDMQREIAFTNNVVMDGRDIGTVVLPNADLKIYLTADEDERARRRKLDYELKGESFNLEEVKKELAERDYRDTHRENSPLRKAHDAVVVDTTNYTIDEVCDQIIDLFNEKRK